MSHARPPTVTYGRRPTLGEVRAYYCRDGFLDLLLQVCETRPVVMVVPSQAHWRPDWDSDRVAAASRDDLRAFILTRINRCLDGLGDADRPPFYPSFHVTLDYWRPGDVDTGANLGCDAVVEADLPTWRGSFQDVMAWVHTLRQANVVHRLKFSGHRSLHLLVPSGGDRLPVRLLAGANARGSDILRLPYSLNEDTGLVSLPLSWERLHTFRPWRANLHLVDIRGDWLRAVSEAERERTRSFLNSLKANRGPRPRPRYQPADHLDNLRAWVARHLEEGSRGSRPECPRAATSPLATAWQRVCGILPVTAEHVRSALGHGDPDVRWLTVEAFLLHGDELPQDLVAELMADDDPYVRSAAVDVIARFAESLTSWFLDRPTSDSLPVASTAATTLGRVACAIGVGCQDWQAAWSLVRKVEAGGHGNPEWAVRRRGLTLIEEMVDHGRRRPQMHAAEELAALGPAVTDLLLLELATVEQCTSRALLISLSLVAGRRTMTRARAQASQGPAREEMDRFLAKLAKPRVRLTEDVSKL